MNKNQINVRLFNSDPKYKRKKEQYSIISLFLVAHPETIVSFGLLQRVHLRTLQLLSMGSRGNNNFEMKSYDYFHTNVSISLVSVSLNNTRL